MKSVIWYVSSLSIATCERGIKELHLLRKCKLSTQSIFPFSCPPFLRCCFRRHFHRAFYSPTWLKPRGGILSVAREKTIFVRYQKRTQERCRALSYSSSSRRINLWHANAVVAETERPVYEDLSNVPCFPKFSRPSRPLRLFFFSLLLTQNRNVGNDR